MTSQELAEATAGDGVTILIAGTNLDLNMGDIVVTDPATNNTLELRNLKIYTGTGSDSGFSLDNTPESPLTLDVISDENSGLTLLQINSSQSTPYSLSAVQTIVDGLDLGALLLKDVWSRNTALSITGDEGGGGDIQMGLSTEGSIGEISLTYNDMEQALAARGIHWAASATGIPEDTSQWSFSGPLSIGDLNGNPAGFDVSGSGLDLLGNPVADPFLMVSLPMQGDLRIEEVAMGANNFGPMALDGLQVHSLHIMIPTPSQ